MPQQTPNTPPKPDVFERIFQPFVPAGHDPLEMLRVKVLLIGFIAMLVMMTRGSVNHVIYGNYALAAGYAAFAMLTIALVWKLHRDKDPSRVGQLAVVMVLCSTAMSSTMTGGLRGTNVAPYFALIFATVLILGRRGFPWVVVAVAIPLGFELAASYGIEFPDRVRPENRGQDAFVTWFSMAVICAAFLLAYEGAREQAADRMVEAARAKSRFIANISHELRTPLQVLTSTYELLGKEQEASTPSALLRTAERNCAALTHLVDNLLDLTALQQRDIEIEVHDFDLHALISDLSLTVRAGGAAEGPQLRIEQDPGVPRFVRGDEAHLRQVLENLLDNAVKFTRHGSIVARISRAEASEPDLYRFSVSDTGVGIPRSALPRVFEEFYQVDDSFTREAQGAGLGLHLASRIVARLGGTLQVDSEEGVRSEFWFSIPLPPGAAPSVETPTKSPTVVATRRILVVEDNVEVRDMTRQLVEFLGFEVRLAVNGQEAVECWRDDPPDLILMDIQMPVMDGLDATKTIRSEERERALQATPIVAVTGHCTDDDRLRCQEAGMNGFLQKPFRLAMLRGVIESGLSADPPPLSSTDS